MVRCDSYPRFHFFSYNIILLCVWVSALLKKKDIRAGEITTTKKKLKWRKDEGSSRTFFSVFVVASRCIFRHFLILFLYILHTITVEIQDLWLKNFYFCGFFSSFPRKTHTKMRGDVRRTRTKGKSKKKKNTAFGHSFLFFFSLF